MRKWIVGAVALVALAVLVVVAAQVASGFRPARPVGFQLIGVADPRGPALPVAIWYPTDATTRPSLLGLAVQFVARDAAAAGTHLPLVVISHGSGGGPGSHVDTALALAAAGFVVAAPMHTGDNYADQSAVGTGRWLPDRSRHVPLVIDHLLQKWPERARIDGGRIGVFGFSAGGFTALTTIGGAPDLTVLREHCRRAPEFACQLWIPADDQLATEFAHDARVKAAVVAAPGYGFAFTKAALAGVTVPVQLWSGAEDQSVPTRTNADVVRAGLARAPELHVVPGAQHFSFLTPCGWIGPPLLCRDGAGFDRRAFHETLDREIVRFFETQFGSRAS